MRLLPAALLLASLLLLPLASACTTTSSYTEVRVRVEVAGELMADLPTSVRVGPNSYCGHDPLPGLSFDGRFVSWHRPYVLGVLDVETGQATSHVQAAIAGGHVAAVERDSPDQAVLTDLRDGSTRVVPAPAGMRFEGNFGEAAVAMDRGHKDGPRMALLDPSTGEWILSGVTLPEAPYEVKGASRDWVVFRVAWERLAAYEVATGRMVEFGEGNPQFVGFWDGRLFLRGSDGDWSVALPDRTRSPEPAPTAWTVGDRTAAFQAGGSTSPASATTAILHWPWHSASPTVPVSLPPDPAEAVAAPPLPAPAVGAALLAAVVVAGAALRRRLPGA